MFGIGLVFDMDPAGEEDGLRKATFPVRMRRGFWNFGWFAFSRSLGLANWISDFAIHSSFA